MNLASELAYFRSRINDLYGAAIMAGDGLPEEAIRHLVEKGPFAHLDEDARTQIIRELEGSFTVRQKRGAFIQKDHEPWLDRRRPDINFYYWNRLKRFYLEGGSLPAHVLATLDYDTDQILDHSGDPIRRESGARRGMVMGNVQSGKTTNYSALICKAADAGYKVIVLLAGITNSLRSQTQERIDDTFIGKKSVFGPVAQESLPIQNYTSARRIPSYGTTRDADFVAGREGMFFTLAGHSEPIIFVTKKNKGVLERLLSWLLDQEQIGGFELPLLLIDDEADNASINTAKDPRRTTAINRVIRQILHQFPRSAYIGYTATPFANIFIDPDTPADMEMDDLFPRNFIKALDPPTNYVGSRRVFWERGNLRPSMVRVIDDYRMILPLMHKRDLDLKELPPSLCHAIRVFCLTRAIRVMRGQERDHCSMMINVSRFNDVQERLFGLVYRYLSALQDAVAVHSGLPLEEIRDPTVADLRESFETEYDSLDVGFGELLPHLQQGVASIRPITVNMRGGALNYSAERERGLHVIAIGGLALSRGLTLEGLTVSYILRNTAASDTLMQMARWFGYRPGYEEICRLYLPQISLSHYEYVDEATEELRSEVKRMETLRQTPAEFGLRVRQSPLAIRVTAANKMRTASEVTIAQDYSARHIEGHALVNSKEANERNLNSVIGFIEKLGTPEPDTSRAFIWKRKSGTDVLNLLRGFEFSSIHPDLGLISDTSLVADYIADRVRGELKEWDVALPQLQSGATTPVAGLQVRLRSRRSGMIDGKSYRINGQRNRVADPDDVRLGLSDDEKDWAKAEIDREDGLRGERAVCAARHRPFLIIHVFNGSIAEGAEGRLSIENPVVTLSFCLPGTSQAARERIYQVNAVYRRQLELFTEEIEDDEELIDRENDAQ